MIVLETFQLTVEKNLKKKKCLLVAIYTPHSQCIRHFTTELTKVLDKCRSKFENIVVLEYFNMEPTNQTMTPFMADNDFIHTNKTNTCFKTSTETCYCKNKSFEKIGFLKDV